MMENFQPILDFWFEGLNDTRKIHKDLPAVRKWFVKNERVDQEIRARFEGELIAARGGKRKVWEDSIRGRVALIVLLDQFSRNIYRDAPQAFAADGQARELTLRTLKDGQDKNLQLIERIFLLMPLQHAEDLKIQELSLECFEDLVKTSREKSPQNTPYYEYSLDYARRHQAIIKRFGRFPHRNAVLGRASLPEELEFLTKPGSSFY